MANKPKPPADFDENPEWTEADFARASSASEMHPPHVAAALVKPRGRPKGVLSSNKQPVSLRLDRDVLEKFKATGPGWQSRINEALRRARV